MGKQHQLTNVELIAQNKLKNLQQLLGTEVIIDSICNLQQRIKLQIFQLQCAIGNPKRLQNKFFVFAARR
jgi:hypothetical protein